VKRYSSGMYVRLAFAVAAHLEPEILIVDEVLAVGDSAFQRKCVGKMHDMQRSGGTMLVVSHNMSVVTQLCTKAILLESGRVREVGDTEKAVGLYHGTQRSRQANRLELRDCARRPNPVLRALEVRDKDGVPTVAVPLGSPVSFRIELEMDRPLSNLQIGLGIDRLCGERVLSLLSPASRDSLGELSGGCEVVCNVPILPIAPGDYSVTVSVSRGSELIDRVDEALCFSVMDGDPFEEGRGFHRGYCLASSIWTAKSNA
jgi:lipopolysaccharide transport system ATP-binding protein